MAPHPVTGTPATRLDQLWFRALAKLRLYRCLVLTDPRLAEPFPEIPLPADLTVRLLTPDDAVAYATFRPEHGRGECDRRLPEGHWRFATWRGRRSSARHGESAVARHLREQGYRRSVATLGPLNRSAASMQDAIGYRPIGWIGYVGLGPWRRVFCRMMPGAKGLVSAGFTSSSS